ncbi:MAG TPA: HPr family phosphocarrier protein [Candidatus Eremiobacteraeota bacterium]|nr:HPr family phosphocarrier protein [Candidatus Eremiobacteraeota bacterium]
MTNKSVIIQKDLHARPATLLIQKAIEYKNTKIWIKRDEKKIRLNSLIALLALGLKKDTVVIIEAEGDVEKEVVELLSDFIEKGMPEDG